MSLFIDPTVIGLRVVMSKKYNEKNYIHAYERLFYSIFGGSFTLKYISDILYNLKISTYPVTFVKPIIEFYGNSISKFGFKCKDKDGNDIRVEYNIDFGIDYGHDSLCVYVNNTLVYECAPDIQNYAISYEQYGTVFQEEVTSKYNNKLQRAR